MKSAETLAALRSRLRISMADMASLLGLNSASAYAYYEDPHRSRRKTVPPKLVRAVLDAAAAGTISLSLDEAKQLLGKDSVLAAHSVEHAEKPRSSPVRVVPTIRVIPNEEGEPVPYWQGAVEASEAEISRMGADADDAVLFVLSEGKFFPEGKSGDYLLATRQDNITHSGFYIFSSPGAMYIYECKRDKKTGGGRDWQAELITQSAAPAKRMTIKENAVAPVWGRVVWHGRNLVPANARPRPHPTKPWLLSDPDEDDHGV